MKYVSVTSEITGCYVLVEHGTATSLHGLRNTVMTGVVREKKDNQQTQRKLASSGLCLVGFLYAVE